jgi:hypothetical protein
MVVYNNLSQNKKQTRNKTSILIHAIQISNRTEEVVLFDNNKVTTGTSH